MKLMTNRKVVLALMSGVIAVALVGSAIASDTKAMSTEGSLLIKTSRELDAFPHLGMSRDQHVSMTSGYSPYYGSDAGSNQGSARALIHLDEMSGLLVNLHNGGFGHRITNYAWGSFGGSDLVDGQILDLDYLKENFSVGVSVGKESETSEDDNGVTSFGGRASFTNGEGQHVAAEVTMASDANDDIDSAFLVSGLYRGEYDNGWTSHAAVYMYKPFYLKDATNTDSELGVMVSAGRRFVNTDRSQVGVEGFLDYIKNSDRGAYDNIVIPGCRVGVSHELTKMLDLHGGVHAGWEIMKENSDEAPGLIGLAADDQGFSYDWTVGLGAHFGAVTLDLNIHPEAVPTLTRFGSEDKMFGQASVEVMW
jgi:hypothetical protein